MKLRKLLSVLLILALCVGLTACTADVTVDITPDTTTVDVVTTTIDTTAGGGNAATSAATDGIDTTAPPATTVGRVTTTKASTTTQWASKPTAAVITVPATTTTTVSAADKQLVDRAFGLAQGAKIEGVTLTGVVTSSQGYSAGYGNATFHIQVQGTDGAKTIYCYRVKPADPARTDVAEGDILTLSGTIQNYKGTIEFYPATYTYLGGGPAPTTTARPTAGDNDAIDEDGIYESKEDVALYIHTYGKLPQNFVTKNEWQALGKPANKCCGGDRFYNKEGLLPYKAGRLYYECDIDSLGLKKRNAKRIVYSNDGLIYYTGDHYASFTLLYGTP